MGTSTTSTVYAAELREIELAFQIASNIHVKTNTPGKCIAFTDNQSAIRAIAIHSIDRTKRQAAYSRLVSVSKAIEKHEQKCGDEGENGADRTAGRSCDPAVMRKLGEAVSEWERK